jgi:hypothetical protein
MTGAAHLSQVQVQPPDETANRWAPAGGDDGVYVYGVARCCSSARTVTPPAEGIVPGAQVRLLPIGRLAAIISPAPVAAFGPDSVHDEDWMRQRAAAHHRVLGALAPLFTLAPMKFGAVCRSLSEVVQVFAHNSARFERALDRAVGASEWGVKVYVSKEARRSTGAEPALRQWAANLHEALAEQTREAVRRRVQWAQFDRGGRRMTLVLSAAYLVEKRMQAEFCQRLIQLKNALPTEYFFIGLTGPWPPYNFVSLTTEAVGHE